MRDSERADSHWAAFCPRAAGRDWWREPEEEEPESARGNGTAKVKIVGDVWSGKPAGMSPEAVYHRGRISAVSWERRAETCR